MKRRDLLTGSIALGAFAVAKTAFGASHPELEEITIDTLSDGMKSGRWTSRKLIDLYFTRLDALDRGGPKLNAVIERNPDAHAIADLLDAERKNGKMRGPLHGIPVLIKDNIDTADKMSTSAGSLALKDWHAKRDAGLVAKVRASGAVIIGKTNLSEWANFRSMHSTSGWSGRGGLTLCPYVLDRNPSGSSSGSAVAVAASLCAVAIGTETSGSVISPASSNGIVGVKPTLGLVAGSGIIPISHNQDTAGPMARTVRDCALLLNAMAEGPHASDFTRMLDANGLRGARIGIARKFYDGNANLQRLLTEMVDVLKKHGAEVVDPADLPSHGKWADPENELLLYDFKHDLNAYLASVDPRLPIHSLADLIAFNEKNRTTEMPYFDQELFIQSQAHGPVTEPNYAKVRTDCLRLTRDEGIDAIISEHKLDAICTLSTGPTNLTDLINGDYDTGSCTAPVAIAGYPHITIPAAFVSELPVGLSFFGPAWSEPTLFKLAYAFEQATKVRRKPKYLARI